MKVVVFEQDGFESLYPLTYLKAAFELRCGALTLLEKVRRKFPDTGLRLEVRDALAGVTRETYGAAVLSGSQPALPDDDLLLISAGAILTAAPETYRQAERAAATQDGDFIWAYLKADTVRGLGAGSARELAALAADRLPAEATDDILIKYPWDLVDRNPAQITADFEASYAAGAGADPGPGVAVFGEPEQLFVGQDVEVQPCTFIDCREGPVVIDDGAVVHAHSSIHGPAYIGRQARLMEARVREGTTVGPVCRVGGEIEESIIHGYANKYHTGFLGHSYVGEWVNLGAMTTNSDLKNDYSNVSVYVNGQPRDTGSMKVGSFIGDHTKTSIGTLLNTGSFVGIMCNLVAGSSVLPKYIPSFCWYLNDRIGKGLGLSYALETARAAMARRGVTLTDAMAKLIEYTEELTRPEKMEKVKRDRRKAFR